MKRPAYRIEYAAEAEEHMSALTAREATTVLDTVPLRVYFDVEEGPERVVKVRAVGLKDRNRVLIGGEEVDLR